MLFNIFMVFSRWKTLVDSIVRITLADGRLHICFNWFNCSRPVQQLHQGVVHKVIRRIDKGDKDLFGKRILQVRVQPGAKLVGTCSVVVTPRNSPNTINVTCLHDSCTMSLSAKFEGPHRLVQS